VIETEERPQTDLGDQTAVERIARLGGVYRWRTVAGLCLCIGLVGLVLASAWLPRFLINGEGTWHLAEALDKMIAFSVLAVAMSLGLSFLYAAWNGGPALSLGIAVVPTVVATLTTGGYPLTQDHGVVLSAGVASAALAVYSVSVRNGDSWRPIPETNIVDCLTVTTSLVVLELGVLLKLTGAVGPHVRKPLFLSWLAWLVAVILIVGGWASCLKADES